MVRLIILKLEDATKRFRAKGLYKVKDRAYHTSEPELAYKVGEPEDVAGLVSYLVKPESKFITGNRLS